MVHTEVELDVLNRIGESSTQPSILRQDSTSPSWHPKISPYRLVVLSTTVGLGTAKAVLTQRGSTVAPIALEWVLGIVVFLLLFSVSTYDTEENVPQSLSWLFKPDCMNLVWPVLATLSIPRPRYISNERSILADAHGKHPPITLYRILVCSSVVSFGLLKAVFGYCGLPAAVTWTDWALAVPITTYLYILGLYQYNSLNLWSSFFVADRSAFFYSANTVLHYTGGSLFWFAWIIAWWYLLWSIFQPPHWTPAPTHLGEPKSSLRIHIEEAGYIGFLTFMVESTIAATAGGLVAVFFLLRPVFEKVPSRRSSGGLARRALRIVRQSMLRLTQRLAPSFVERSLQTWRPWHFPSRYPSQQFFAIIHSIPPFLIRTVPRLFYIAFNCSLALIVLQLTLTGYDIVNDKEAYILLRALFALFLAILAPMPLGLVVLAFLVAFWIFSPEVIWFWEWRLFPYVSVSPN